MIVPSLLCGKLFVPNAFDAWLEYGFAFSCTKALLDGVKGLRKFVQWVFKSQKVMKEMRFPEVRMAHQ